MMRKGNPATRKGRQQPNPSAIWAETSSSPKKPQDSNRKPLATPSPLLVLSFPYCYLSKGNSIGICFSKLVLQGKSISSVMVIRCLLSLVPVKPRELQILTYRNRPLEQSLCKRSWKPIWHFSPGRARCSSERSGQSSPELCKQTQQDPVSQMWRDISSPTWPAQLLSIPITSLPLKPSLAHSSLYLQGVWTFSDNLYQPRALSSCGTPIHARTRASTRKSHQSLFTFNHSNTTRNLGFEYYLSAGFLRLYSLAGSLHQAGSRSAQEWVRTHRMERKPRNCGMSITPWFF